MHSWKKWLGIVLVVLAITVLLFGIRFIRATSLFSTIEEVDASCRVIQAVPGPEDIVIDRARGLAFVSATNRRVLMAGGKPSASLRGVMSSFTATKCVIVPSASRIGEIDACSQ